MIENGIYMALAADAGVGALLPSPASENIFHSRMEKDTIQPVIVFLVASSGSINTLRGENELQSASVQFDCYGPVRFSARTLAKAVKQVFIPRSDGTGFPQFPYSLPDGTQIQSAEVVHDRDWSFEEAEGGYAYRRLLEISFYFIDVA